LQSKSEFAEVRKLGDEYLSTQLPNGSWCYPLGVMDTPKEKLPSGTSSPKGIEAEAISPADEGLSVLSVAPKPLFSMLDTRALHRPQGPKSGIAAVFGRWPGDESDEEIGALLAETS
jgi:hypothetical protein